MPSASLKTTPLHAAHVAAGARMVDFAGWDMPVQYDGVIGEHQRVRQAVGLFDVSHMGEVDLKGPGALGAVQRLVTGDMSDLAPGQARYTVMCNERGGIVDDLIVYRVADEGFFLCINAATTEKDVAWMRQHVEGWLTSGDIGAVELTDRSSDYALIAVQGPKAAELLASYDASLLELERFALKDTELAGVAARVCRTGYTGEDGFELFISPEAAGDLWARLMTDGEPHGVGPTGLGARDTLRLEARLHLYGNDIDDDTTPYEGGLGWVVAAGKDVPFVGQEALAAQKAAGIERKLVAFVMNTRAVPRHGYEIVTSQGGEPVGEVTSGTWSPTLEQGIGLGYVPKALAKAGSELHVRIRRRDVAATVRRGPFYKRDAR